MADGYIKLQPSTTYYLNLYNPTWLRARFGAATLSSN